MFRYVMHISFRYVPLWIRISAKFTMSVKKEKKDRPLEATYNEIVKDVTHDTIVACVSEYQTTGVFPQNLEARLLETVNYRLETENALKSSGPKHKLLTTLTNSQVAQILLNFHNIVRIAPSDKNTDREYDLLAMYVPDGDNCGIYTTSEDEIRAVAREYNYSLTINDFKEIYANLKDLAPRRYRCHDRDLIAVGNGIFHYGEKTLHQFSPDYVFLSKSHVNYNPSATNVVIHNDADGTDWDVESWVASLSDDPEIVDLLWEILGAIIRPHVRWNKSAWFYSEKGNNGKGTLVELMRNLCGPSAYASIPISDFSKDFLLEPLTRASAILVDENDVGVFVDKAANLKAVITNDVIAINRKYRAPIAYQFFGFMVQCLNEFPRIKDKSESFYRRQLFVPFEKCFTGAERKYIKNDYLHRDDVLEYVLYRVLNMNYYELSEPAAATAVLDQYKEFNDPIRAFWNELSPQFSWKLLPFTFLYDLYQAWYSKNEPSGKPAGRNTFIQNISNLVDGDKDSLWVTKPNNGQWNTKDLLCASEPLIVEYGVRSWMGDTKSNDPLIMSVPSRVSSRYRGLLAISEVPHQSSKN